MPYIGPPTARTEFPHIPVAVPAKDGGFRRVDRAAVGVLARRGDRASHSTGAPVFQGSGILDSGASMSAVPLWLVCKLGIPVDRESKRTMYSASDRFEAFEVDIGMDMRYGGRWLDMGAIRVVVPDTARSRDQGFQCPILLGLDGFFDRFEVYISHAKKRFWLGEVCDWPGKGRPHSGSAAFAGGPPSRGFRRARASGSAGRGRLRATRGAAAPGHVSQGSIPPAGQSRRTTAWQAACRYG